ncbi:MAG: radical SAM protein [Sedimentisphaerales bacterium]|nr:radical SAM protein [Sedimentisphaerales bacterium]
MIYNKTDITPENLDAEMNQLARRLKLDDINQALTFPRFILVETVRICNARCPFCTVDKWDPKVPFMPEPLFDKIADELIEHADWIFYVYLQKAGEPLLDKHITRRIRRLKEGGIRRINLSTNASLLNEARATELLEAGLDEIMLSIDSIQKEKYEEMRPGLKFDTVIRNIKTYFRMRDQVKPDSVIRVRGVSFYDLDNPEDQESLQRWEEFWEELKKPQDRIYMKRPHSWGNQHKWDDHIPKYDLTYHPCILPWSTFNISSDGTVPLCGQDYDGKMQLGDVNQQTIKEIWNSKKWHEIRTLHSRGDRNELPFCRGCRLFDLDFSLEKNRPEELLV